MTYHIVAKSEPVNPVRMDLLDNEDAAVLAASVVKTIRKAAYNLPISVLTLSNRAENALRRNGVHTIGHFIQAYHANRLTAGMPGMGHICVAEYHKVWPLVARLEE